MSVQRRTKIVATLGPASSSEQIIAALIDAGVDVFRLNFSHGQVEDHRARAGLVRMLAARAGHEVALLGDLQGPKIRIRSFRDGAAAIMPQAVWCVTRRTIRTCVRLTRKRGAGYTSQRGSNMAGRGKHR